MDNKETCINQSPIWIQKETPSFDVGIVGIWLVKNYGNSLTYYALYHCICDLGYTPLMIERSSDAPAAPEYSTPPLFKKCPYPDNNMSRIYSNRIDMKNLNKKCKMFLVGSDQLLYQKLYFLFGKHINLSWVYDENPKIAYAVSLGHDDDSADCEKGDKAYYFSKFDAFSVREPSAVQIVREKYNINAQCVLDPVFICKREHFDKLLDNSCSSHESAYIGGYILNPNDYKATVLKKISSKLKMPLHIYGDADHDVEYSADKTLKELGFAVESDETVESWLKNLTKSSLFVTDSYHGMCMAIIYHIPFIIIKNEVRGSTRFEHLIELLGLNNHVLTEGEELSEKHISSIDFKEIDKRLEKKIRYSLLWLKNALLTGNELNKSRSTYDIVDQRCDDLLKYCIGLETHCHGLQKYCDGLDKYCRDISQANDVLRSENIRFNKLQQQLRLQLEQCINSLAILKEQDDIRFEQLQTEQESIRDSISFHFIKRIKRLLKRLRIN